MNVNDVSTVVLCVAQTFAMCVVLGFTVKQIFTRRKALAEDQKLLAELRRLRGDAKDGMNRELQEYLEWRERDESRDSRPN